MPIWARLLSFMVTARPSPMLSPSTYVAAPASDGVTSRIKPVSNPLDKDIRARSQALPTGHNLLAKVVKERLKCGSFCSFLADLLAQMKLVESSGAGRHPLVS